MKKIILFAFVIALFLAGCGQSVQTDYSKDNKSMFTIVEDTEYWYVVYDNETKVMYAVSDGAYNRGTFTMLVDADGKPMIWEGEP